MTLAISSSFLRSFVELHPQTSHDFRTSSFGTLAHALIIHCASSWWDGASGWLVFGLVGAFNDHSSKRSRNNPLKTLLISTSRGWAFGVIPPSIMIHLSNGWFALWALTFLSKWPQNASSTNPPVSFRVPSSTPTTGENKSLRYSSVWSPLDLEVGDTVMYHSSVDGYSFPHLYLRLWWISYVTVPFIPQGFTLGAGFALKIMKGMPYMSK